MLLMTLTLPIQAGIIPPGNVCTSEGVPGAGITCSVVDAGSGPGGSMPVPPMLTSLGPLNSNQTLSITWLSGMIQLDTIHWLREDGTNDFWFNPDGSLGYPDTTQDWQTANFNYNYLKPGAAYPNIAGGDGINHFPGGGGNYDMYYMPPDTGWGYFFGNSFAQTTDTLAPGVVRFGSLIGTLDDGANWFFIGYGRTIGAGTDIPIPDGATLNLTVFDVNYGQNAGAYQVGVSVADVPEPSMFLLAGSGLGLLVLVRRRRA